MKKKFLLCALVILLALFTFIPNAFAISNISSGTCYIDCTDSQQDYGELVSSYNSLDSGYSNSNSSEMVAVLCRTDGNAVDFKQWSPRYILAGPCNCFTLIFADEYSAELAVDNIAELPHVIYAECDSEVTACQDESISFESWSAEQMSYASYVSFSGEYASSESVTVAVVDSGVYLHSDIKSRIKEVGYDYIDSDTDPTNDIFGHGTGIAGVVGDCTQTLPVNIYPVRVLNTEGKGSVSNVVNGIRESIEKDVDVINLSLSSKTHSDALDSAIADAIDAGICVVTAAGNNGIDSSNVCPGHIDTEGVIVVGSIESDGTISSYSNYGESVDVYAYGTKVRCCSQTGGYAYKTGTSFSAAHVSALSAMIALTHPDILPSEIESRICAADSTQSDIYILDASALVPENVGFNLTSLKLNSGESIELPQSAFPLSCCEHTEYTSSNENIVTVSNGKLCAIQQGTAVITARCLGFEDKTFTVNVGSFSGIISKIPQGIKSIKAGAFSGCTKLRILSIPSSVELIESDAFDDTVLLCCDGSYAAEYALNSGISYIIK